MYIIWKYSTEKKHWKVRWHDTEEAFITKLSYNTSGLDEKNVGFDHKSTSLINNTSEILIEYI